jgi:hypothetical protein
MKILLTGPPSSLLDVAASAIGRHFALPPAMPDSVTAVRRLNDRMLALAGCTRWAAVADVPARLPAALREDLARRARRVVEVRLERTWVMADPAWALTASLWADALEPDLVVVGWRAEHDAINDLVDLGAASLDIAGGLYSLYLTEAMRRFATAHTMCVDLSRFSNDVEAVDPADVEVEPEPAPMAQLTSAVLESLERHRRAVVLDALLRVTDESELEHQRRALDVERRRLEEYEAEVLRSVRDPVEQLRRRLAEVMLDRSRLVQEEHDRRQERNRVFLEKRALQEEYDALRARLESQT